MQEARKPKNNPSESIKPSENVGAESDHSMDDDDTLDLSRILDYAKKMLLPHWKRYGVVIFLGGFFFALFSYLIVPVYRATALVQIASNSSSSMLKNRLKGLMGTSALMDTDTTDTLFNVAYLTSRETADAFVEKYGLREIIFDKLFEVQDPQVMSAKLAKKYRRLLGDDYATLNDQDVYLTPGPSKQQVYKTFNQIFIIDVDKKDMSVSVSVCWKNPRQARDWANDYIHFVNDTLREKAIQESESRIAYLRKQISETPEVEVQRSIFSLIEDEMKKIAVAESSEDYAFKVVQRAYLPERRIKPNRWRFLFCGFFMGAVLTTLQIVGLDYRKKRKALNA